MSDFAGMRLNPDKDADIIADLNKYKSKTDRIKEVYRKVLAMERKGYTPTEAAPKAVHETPSEEPKTKEAPAALTWNFPKEPTVKGVKAEEVEPSKDKDKLKSNILSNNF